jgi:hypothetical protein
MSLKGYKPETRVIPLNGDNSFAVRGLSLVDVSVLIRQHFPDLDAIADLFFNGLDNLTPAQAQSLALAVVSQMPGLAANMIAMAADEGDASDAEKLPMPTQIKALLEIGDLTFNEVGGVKKGVEMIAALLLKTNAKTKLSKVMTRTG